MPFRWHYFGKMDELEDAYPWLLTSTQMTCQTINNIIFIIISFLPHFYMHASTIFIKSFIFSLTNRFQELFHLSGYGYRLFAFKFTLATKFSKVLFLCMRRMWTGSKISIWSNIFHMKFASIFHELFKTISNMRCTVNQLLRK